MRSDLRLAAAGARRRVASLFLVLLVCWITGGTASAGTAAAAGSTGVDTATATAIPGQALVRFARTASDAARAAVHASAGARVLRRTEAIRWELVSFPAGIPVDRILNLYRANPLVEAAEPNLAGTIALAPSDSCAGSACSGVPGQWHLKMTNAPMGWDIVPGRTYTAHEKLATSPVTIAVLDSKIHPDHPDWANPGGGADTTTGGQLDLANARDWVPPSKFPGPNVYHGMFVAGLAAAATGNGGDVAGVGYAARVMPLTVSDGSGRTDAAALTDALVYAWQRGARVINLSLGIAAPSEAVHDAIRLVSTGTTSTPPSLLVAAAGNNMGSAPFYPGSYPEVMSVSGTDAADRRAPCSNYNANVSVSAPADRLYGLTVMPNRLIQAVCGTSAAAPQVSGLAALLFAQDPSRTPTEVRRIIERTADDLGTPGRDDFFGHGRINVERALRAGTSASITTAARATVPTSSRVSTITAAASSAYGVRAAQMIFDRPDAASVAMQAADGSFGGTTEALRGTFTVPAGTAAGPHPIWVHAFDGTSWGPTTVGVLIVDGTAPVVTDAVSSNAIRVAGQPVEVTFTASDDQSPTLSYFVTFQSSTTGKVVLRGAGGSVPAGAQRYAWMPPLDAVPGHYLIVIQVYDQAGNYTNKAVGTYVV